MVEVILENRIRCFEDLDVWKESMRLAVDIYRCFNNCRDYGFRDQIRRAAVSVPSNIAEGFERSSNKEFIYFLHISQSSNAELRTQLYLAKELEYLEKSDGPEYIERTRKISAMLYRLIKTRKEKFD